MINIATNVLVATEVFQAGETSYIFNFDYLNKTYVKARYVNSTNADDIDAGIQLEYGTDYMVDDKTITLTTAGDSSKFLYVYRETPTDLIVVFEDSSIVRAKDFNTNNTQVQHILEELSDYLILHKISDETLAFVQNSVEQIEKDLITQRELLEQVKETAEEALSIRDDIVAIKEQAETLLEQTENVTEQASDYAQQAQESATINSAPAYDPEKTYSFPDVIAYTDGYVYRCIGENVSGVDPSNSQYWVRIQTTYSDYFEIDLYGGLMPTLNPTYSENFILDYNGDIMPRDEE